MSFQSDRRKKKVGKPFYDLGSLELKTSQNEQKPILKRLQSENKKEFLEICQEITDDRYSEVVKLVCDRGEIITVPLSVVLLSSCEYLKELIKRVVQTEDIIISLPGASYRTVQLAIKFLSLGYVDGLSFRDVSSLKEFLSYIRMGNKINYSESSESINKCDFTEPDEFYEDSNVVYADSTPNVNIHISNDLSNLCASLCVKKCYKIAESWSREDIITLQTMFKGDSSISTKQKLIDHIHSQQNIGLSTKFITIKGQAFCLKFLSNISNISLYTLKKVISDYDNGVRIYSHGNGGVLKQYSQTTLTFIAWFTKFCELNGQCAPDCNVTVLPFWLYEKVIYDIYKKEVPAPHLQLSTFYQTFKKHFGPDRQDKTSTCVRISKYSSHSVCDLCAAFDAYQKLATSESELDMAKSMKNKHRMDYMGARREVECLKQSALNFPEENLFLQIDG